MALYFIFFFLMIPFWFWIMITFDNLLKLEYEEFHHQWIKDGRQKGMFWRPPASSLTPHIGMGRQTSMFIWLFKQPAWMKSSEQAVKLLWRFRVLVLVWNASVLLWMYGGRFFWLPR
jgi:hypothetical protein